MLGTINNLRVRRARPLLVACASGHLTLLFNRIQSSHGRSDYFQMGCYIIEIDRETGAGCQLGTESEVVWSLNRWTCT